MISVLAGWKENNVFANSRIESLRHWSDLHLHLVKL
jgi:hypothetical protein